MNSGVYFGTGPLFFLIFNFLKFGFFADTWKMAALIGLLSIDWDNFADVRNVDHLGRLIELLTALGRGPLALEQFWNILAIAINSDWLPFDGHVEANAEACVWIGATVSIIDLIRLELMRAAHNVQINSNPIRSLNKRWRIQSGSALGMPMPLKCHWIGELKRHLAVEVKSCRLHHNSEVEIRAEVWNPLKKQLNNPISIQFESVGIEMTDSIGRVEPIANRTAGSNWIGLLASTKMEPNNNIGWKVKDANRISSPSQSPPSLNLSFWNLWITGQKSWQSLAKVQGRSGPTTVRNAAEAVLKESWKSCEGSFKWLT